MTRPTLPQRARGVAVKVCGLTRPADAALAAELGADALGVVFAPSPRQVALAQAVEVLGVAPPGVLRVGVFVDPEPRFVAEAVGACGLGWVQLSGREPAEVALKVMEAVRGEVGLGAAVPGSMSAAGTGAAGVGAAGGPPGLLKAVHVRSEGDLLALADYPADAFLLDAPPRGGRMGGTGRSFDWNVVVALPWARWRVALAGGLTADNLALAVAAVRPAMVDVSSGVESAPGIKDAGRMRAFMEAARRIEPEEDPWRG